jgi:hypothetical protein
VALPLALLLGLLPGVLYEVQQAWNEAILAGALLLAAAAAYAVALRCLPRDGAGPLLGWALILASWDLLNKQSFLNQWLLVAQLTVAALALAATRHAPPDRPETRQTDHQPLGRLTTRYSAD